MKLTALALLLPLVVAPAFAQSSGQIIRVRVNVMADRSIQDQVGSLIRRELRGLHDVTVSEDNPDFVLQMFSGVSKLTSGRAAGYYISFVVYSPCDTNLLHLVCPTNAPPMLYKYFTSLVSLEDQGIAMESDLRKTCEQVVAYLDSHSFDEYRKGVEEGIRRYERARKPAPKPGLKAKPVDRST